MMSRTASIKHRGRAEYGMGLSSSPLHLAWSSRPWAPDPRAHSALSTMPLPACPSLRRPFPTCQPPHSSGPPSRDACVPEPPRPSSQEASLTPPPASLSPVLGVEIKHLLSFLRIRSLGCPLLLSDKDGQSSTMRPEPGEVLENVKLNAGF